MITPLFAVYDSKALTFSQPFVQHNADTAKRAFAQSANTPGNNIYENPEDFSLIEIGEYNDELGETNSLPHINHGLARQFVKGV